MIIVNPLSPRFWEVEVTNTLHERKKETKDHKTQNKTSHSIIITITIIIRIDKYCDIILTIENGRENLFKDSTTNEE